MIKNIKRFLSKIIIATMIVCVPVAVFSASNLPTGEIGDYGSWTTKHNQSELVKNLIGGDDKPGDLIEFQSEFQKQLVRDYVPIEASVGVAMLGGLNHMAKILDGSLVRFMNIFLIIMYIFWIMLEAYNMMSTDQDVKKLIKSIVKQTIIVIIWITVLYVGPAKLFMAVVGPIIALGSYISDFILNAITQTAGITIPDTCNAISEYTATAIPKDIVMSAKDAASLLCVPTRLSGFFVTAISAGWHWMIYGIGHSTITFLIGSIFIVVFAWNAWKFMLMALSVIMNLFLAVILLPFTAFAESIPKTSYKGIIGNIYNSFIGLFDPKTVKLDAQINRFINAAIYFVSLSIVIAICAALLSGVINIDMETNIPTLENDGFIPILLTGALVAWLANKADSIARTIGGALPEGKAGENFTNDIKTVAKDTRDSAYSWLKAYFESKK